MKRRWIADKSAKLQEALGDWETVNCKCLKSQKRSLHRTQAYIKTLTLCYLMPWYSWRKSFLDLQFYGRHDKLIVRGDCSSLSLLAQKSWNELTEVPRAQSLESPVVSSLDSGSLPCFKAAREKSGSLLDDLKTSNPRQDHLTIVYHCHVVQCMDHAKPICDLGQLQPKLNESWALPVHRSCPLQSKCSANRRQLQTDNKILGSLGILWSILYRQMCGNQSKEAHGMVVQIQRVQLTQSPRPTLGLQAANGLCNHSQTFHCCWR